MKLGKDITKIVIAKLDEFSPYMQGEDGPLVTAGDVIEEVKPVYDLVEKFLPEAADEACMIMPLHQLIPVDAIANCDLDVIPGDHKTFSFVVKPDDFLRLHTMMFHSWKQPVNEVCHEGSVAFKSQGRPWTRGTCDKPVVTSIPGLLGCYSVPEGACLKPTIFLYVPKFGKHVEYSDMGAELIALYTAKKVFEAFNNSDNIKIMNDAIAVVQQNMVL